MRRSYLDLVKPSQAIRLTGKRQYARAVELEETQPDTYLIQLDRVGLRGFWFWLPTSELETTGHYVKTGRRKN